MSRHNGGHPAGKNYIDLAMLADETLMQIIMGGFGVLAERHEVDIIEVIKDCLESVREAAEELDG